MRWNEGSGSRKAGGALSLSPRAIKLSFGFPENMQSPASLDAPGGSRTHTTIAGHRILSPKRLPFRHGGWDHRVILYALGRIVPSRRACSRARSVHHGERWLKRSIFIAQ